MFGQRNQFKTKDETGIILYLSLFHTSLEFFGRESFLSVLNTGRNIFALLLYSVGLTVSGDVNIKFILPLMCMQFLK